MCAASTTGAVVLRNCLHESSKGHILSLRMVYIHDLMTCNSLSWRLQQDFIKYFTVGIVTELGEEEEEEKEGHKRSKEETKLSIDGMSIIGCNIATNQH